jgi:hypothetical protein
MKNFDLNRMHKLAGLLKESKELIKEGIDTISMTTSEMTGLFLTKQLDRDYKKAKDEIDRIENIKNNINKEMTKLISMLKNIETKHNVKVLIETGGSSSGSKFNVRVISDQNDALYEDLEKIGKFLNSTKSMALQQHSSGHPDIDYFNYNNSYIFWVR